MNKKIEITRSEMLSIVRHWYLNEEGEILQNEEGSDLEEIIEREVDEDVYIPVEIKE